MSLLISFITTNILLILPINANGSSWQITPAVSVVESYSDNIELASVPDLEQSELVTQISPSLNVLYPGRQSQIFANYSIQSLNYTQESGRNQVFHQLSAQAMSEIYNDSLFIDATSSISQQTVDPEERVSLRNIAVTNNLTDVTSLSLSPYYRLKFRNTGEFLLRVKRGEVNYAEESLELVDSNIDSIIVDLSDKHDSRLFNWQINFNKDEMNFDNGITNEFQHVLASLILNVGQKTKLIFTSGSEDNQFQSQSSLPVEGSFWRAEIDWQGGSGRSHFQIRFGERFFGDTGMMQWSYNGKNLSIKADYSEELFTDAQRHLDRSAQVDRSFSEVLLFRSSSEVYLRKRMDTKLVFNRSKTSVTLTSFSEEREYQMSADKEDASGIKAQWDWRITGRSLFSIGLTSRQDEFRDTDREDEIKDLRVTFNRKLNDKLSANIKFVREKLSSTLGLISYQVNMLSLGMDREF